MFNLTTTPVMPSKVTLFDLKCEPLFDFGTGPRNEVFYNPQGNNILTDWINIILFFSLTDYIILFNITLVCFLQCHVGCHLDVMCDNDMSCQISE